MVKMGNRLLPHLQWLNTTVQIATPFSGPFPLKSRTLVNRWPSKVQALYGELLYDRWFMDLYYVTRNAVFFVDKPRNVLLFKRDPRTFREQVSSYVRRAVGLWPMCPDYSIVGQPAVFPLNGGLYINPLVAHTTAQRKGFIAGYFGEGLGRSVLTKALGVNWTQIWKIEPLRGHLTPDFVVVEPSNRVQVLAEVKSTTKSKQNDKSFWQLASVKGTAKNGASSILGLGMSVIFYLGQNKPVTVVVQDPEYSNDTYDVTADLYFKGSVIASISDMLSEYADGRLGEFRERNRGLAGWAQDVSETFKKVVLPRLVEPVQFRLPASPDQDYPAQIEWILPRSMGKEDFAGWLDLLLRPPVSDSANFFRFLHMPY